MCACVHGHVRVNVQACSSLCMHPCMHSFMQAYLHACVHVSAQVDAHLRVLGFWPRRWRGGAVLVFRRTAAASAQSFPRIRLPCALALVSAPLWLGERYRCRSAAEAFGRCLSGLALRTWLAVMASFQLRFCLCVPRLLGSKQKPRLRRRQRLSGARLVMDQRTSGDVRKISRVF